MRLQLSKKNGLYFVIDRQCSCGITDRLKAAVGLYYLARNHNIRFRFIHTAGFDIREYLQPNTVPWGAELSELAFFPWNATRFTYAQPYDNIPQFLPGHQYICRSFIGNNILEKQNVPDWENLWRKLFNELFVPARKVLDAMADSTLPENYAVVNARFINSLGRFEQVNYNAPLSEEIQLQLIDAVLKKVDECQKTTSAPVIVYSDSIRFLEAASAHGFQICDTSLIGHIADPNAGGRVLLGNFVNFFQIANASAVYSIRSVEGFPKNCLYTTQYPRYAAIVGNKPFIRVEADQAVQIPQTPAGSN